ncbi:MAG: efflux RND transporter periplasmic adaptor subunit [Myxococcota bacterium]|nr:efflux RND transporter periplasmic adaptor subunit [Myxococcota bacterium]
MRRSIVGHGIVLALALAGALGCGESQSGAVAAGRPPAPVRIEELRAAHHARALVVPGIVEPKSRIALGFRVAGFVERIHVDEGDPVEAGATIAELDLEGLDREVHMAAATLRRAEARAAQATLDFERQDQLVASDSTSKQRHDQARSALDVARAEAAEARLALEAARARREKGVLRAPVSGHIEARHLEPAELAAADVPVVTLVELDPVTVRAAVADSAVALVRVGTEAVVRAGGREQRGAVTRLAVAADPATRTVPFEVSLANPDLVLRPETVVTVEIRAEAEAPTHTVPLSSVLRGVDLEPFCFVAVDDGAVAEAARRKVRLGTVVRDRVTILAGLAEGDRVVTSGQHFLKEGDALEIIGE